MHHIDHLNLRRLSLLRYEGQIKLRARNEFCVVQVSVVFI